MSTRYETEETTAKRDLVKGMIHISGARPITRGAWEENATANDGSGTVEVIDATNLFIIGVSQIGGTDVIG